MHAISLHALDAILDRPGTFQVKNPNRPEAILFTIVTSLVDACGLQITYTSQAVGHAASPLLGRRYTHCEVCAVIHYDSYTK